MHYWEKWNKYQEEEQEREPIDMTSFTPSKTYLVIDLCFLILNSKMALSVHVEKRWERSLLVMILFPRRAECSLFYSLARIWPRKKVFRVANCLTKQLVNCPAIADDKSDRETVNFFLSAAIYHEWKWAPWAAWLFNFRLIYCYCRP